MSTTLVLTLALLPQSVTPLPKQDPQAGLPLPSPAPAALEYTPSSTGLQLPGLEGGDVELEFGDTNGDGHLDLLSIGDHGSPFVNTSQHGIMTWFGDGRGGWTLFQNGNFGYGGIAVGDVNGDGDLDVGYGMHHNYSSSDFGDQLLEVALGDGTGLGWTPWDDGLATNGETWGMFATDFADVDNDGLLDVLSNSFGCCAGTHVYRNLGDGTWEQSFGFLGGNANHFAEFADFDGDGNPDFATANDQGDVWRGDGAGAFTLIAGNLPGSAYGRAGFDTGDVDGDGRDEYAFRLAGGELRVLELVSGSTWSDLSAGLPTTSSYSMVQLADMDMDGRLDLVAFGGGQVGVYIGDGGGEWQLGARIDLPAAGSAVMLRAADFDHNGRPDVALIQDENCGLFCSVNRLYAYREASDPAHLAVELSYPRGGETWVEGSARTVRWQAAVPGGRSVADVKLSTSGPAGPWKVLAKGVPDDGVQQVRVPTGVASSDCLVRVVVATPGGGTTAHSPAPFTIVP